MVWPKCTFGCGILGGVGASSPRKILLFLDAKRLLLMRFQVPNLICSAILTKQNFNSCCYTYSLCGTGTIACTNICPGSKNFHRFLPVIIGKQDSDSLSIDRVVLFPGSHPAFCHWQYLPQTMESWTWPGERG